MNYKGEYGYHPIFCFWAEEGELLNSHLRRGTSNSLKTLDWFFNETLKVVPKGKKLKLRADSAFYKLEFMDKLNSMGITYAITARTSPALKLAIKAIAEKDWKKYGAYSGASVTELRFAPQGKQYRYVIKRFPSIDQNGNSCYEYYQVVTNDLRRSAKQIIKWALGRCAVENFIKEHKSTSGFGLEKLPTQRFHANYAWLLIRQLVFNLIAWFKRVILPKQYHRSTIKTIRHRLFYLGGRIVKSVRQSILVLSDQYFFKDVWMSAINKLASFIT